MDMNYEYDKWSTLLQIWAPRVIGAVIIMAIAWIVGRALKWAIAKGVDKLPVAHHHNRTGSDPKATVGHRLGDVAYWLVLLFGVIAALKALQLDAVAAPVNTLLNNVFSYIPNVVGAALIFFIGFILATLAQRLVSSALEAANADQWLAKAGLGGTTSTSGGGLSKVLGTVVFVLIIIPVAIAALQQLGIEAISRPAIAVLTTILNAVPNVIAAAIVLGIGWFIGRWISGLVTNLLSATSFDRTVGALGSLSTFGSTSSAPPSAITSPSQNVSTSSVSGPSKWVGNLVLFAIVAFSAIEAARLLQFAAISVILEQILGLAGRVIVGAVLIMAGVLIADVLGNAIGKSTSQQDRFAATLVRWAVIALSVAMGLRFMGIADEIVILAFGLILGSAAVAAALAFGLGGKEAAAKVANRWASRMDQPPK